MDYTVAAFYTDSYKRHVSKLIESAKKFGLPIITHRYPDTGVWVKNAAMKSVFLQRMLLECSGDILYVDADAQFRAYPAFFDDFDGDIGVHYRDRGGGRTELLSGTIYLKNNEPVRKLVEDWIWAQDREPLAWDQRILEKLLSSNLELCGRGLKVTQLPAAYTQIFDSMRHYGQPVIEHHQASRKKRRKEPMKVPHHIGKVRIRQTGNSQYFITRGDKKAEGWLDENLIRIPGELSWQLPVETTNTWEQLRPHFEGKTATIVGKGPSLDQLKASDLGDGPVIALNEAIFKVEEVAGEGIGAIFGLQQDSTLKNTCLPEHSKLLVAQKAVSWYSDFADQVIPFYNMDLGLSRSALSVCAAIEISKQLGAKALRLVCFDASVNKSCKYARCIGSSPQKGGKPSRFLGHRAKILRRTGKVPVEWVIPT